MTAMASFDDWLRAPAVLPMPFRSFTLSFAPPLTQTPRPSAQDIAKLRTSIKEAEERLRVKQLLAEVLEKLQLGEEEVEKVAAAATPEQPSSEAVAKMEKANASAQMKLSTTLNLVEIKLKSAQGFLQEELTAMQLRIKKAEKKLEKVIAAATEQKERLRASELIAQCLDKADTCEAALRKASEAELPFLKGTEALSSAETQKAVADCEAAAAVAQKAITDARAVTLQNLAAAKEFANGADEFCTKDLLLLQKRLDGMAGKLSELKKETADRKRKAQLGASAEKVADVEAGVAKLAATMQSFSDDSLTQLSSPEAGRPSVMEGKALSLGFTHWAKPDLRVAVPKRGAERPYE
ncbi:unnamed protein product [Symbiodinium sp. CCMP2456]|nr:unnamed protein product [Symbiodinium sp. CCMP2456]